MTNDMQQEKIKTSWIELVEYIDANDWMVTDWFSYHNDPWFPQKVEFVWNPNVNNFNTQIIAVRVYVDLYQEVNYETFINFYVELEWKKSYETHRIKIMPMYDDATGQNDYSNIETNLFYTMYNMLYHYASNR